MKLGLGSIILANRVLTLGIARVAQPTPDGGARHVPYAEQIGDLALVGWRLLGIDPADLTAAVARQVDVTVLNPVDFELDRDSLLCAMRRWVVRVLDPQPRIGCCFIDAGPERGRLAFEFHANRRRIAASVFYEQGNNGSFGTATVHFASSEVEESSNLWGHTSSVTGWSVYSHHRESSHVRHEEWRACPPSDGRIQPLRSDRPTVFVDSDRRRDSGKAEGQGAEPAVHGHSGDPAK